jgi:hypothetical protein
MLFYRWFTNDILTNYLNTIAKLSLLASSIFQEKYTVYTYFAAPSPPCPSKTPYKDCVGSPFKSE